MNGQGDLFPGYEFDEGTIGRKRRLADQLLEGFSPEKQKDIIIQTAAEIGCLTLVSQKVTIESVPEAVQQYL